MGNTKAFKTPDDLVGHIFELKDSFPCFLGDINQASKYKQQTIHVFKGTKVVVTNVVQTQRAKGHIRIQFVGSRGVYWNGMLGMDSFFWYFKQVI